MPDEIDLLRRFRDDTPGPDDAAWAAARSAVLSARELTLTAGGGRWRPVARRTLLAAAVAVAVAVAAGFLVGALRPAPSLSGPAVTAWQPARTLPASATGLRVQAGGWRLMSYLAAHGWQENTSGPEPGYLTCPTARACYVEGDNASSSSGPADMDTLYVSSDGGATWSTLPVPPGVTFTSALACASVDDCTAGGPYYGHQPVYLTTTAGGHSWTMLSASHLHRRSPLRTARVRDRSGLAGRVDVGLRQRQDHRDGA
jgi:hypothetical protein